MKDIKVIKYFVDKYNPSVGFQVGTVISFEDERANNVVSRGLAVFVKAADNDGKPVETPKTDAEKPENPVEDGDSAKKEENPTDPQEEKPVDVVEGGEKNGEETEEPAQKRKLFTKK